MVVGYHVAGLVRCRRCPGSPSHGNPRRPRHWGTVRCPICGGSRGSRCDRCCGRPGVCGDRRRWGSVGASWPPSWHPWLSSGGRAPRPAPVWPRAHPAPLLIRIAAYSACTNAGSSVDAKWFSSRRRNCLEETPYEIIKCGRWPKCIECMAGRRSGAPAVSSLMESIRLEQVQASRAARSVARTPLFRCEGREGQQIPGQLCR